MSNIDYIWGERKWVKPEEDWNRYTLDIELNKELVFVYLFQQCHYF